jgi:Animal haem peroxidase
MALDVVEETGQIPGAAAGFTAHGAAEPRGQSAVPLSVLFEGRFGRMFRDPGIKIVEHTDNALIHLGKTMREPDGTGAGEDNKNIPAAYTYLGQFIDHDITFDPTSLQQQVNDPDALTDFRTPRYDLDSLYGRGPDDDPFLYEWTDPRFRGIKLLAGRNPESDVDGTPLTKQDLPRNEQGRALIGDPRNDENIIISQLHLAFIKLHDRVVDQVAKIKLPDGQPKYTGRRLFEESQRWVRWHYQWMVVHDFLKKVSGEDVVNSILKNESTPTGPVVELQFYQPKEQPFMPIEFSAAAFRFGHSMIRASYDLNDEVVNVDTFVDDPNAAGPFGHLGGFRRLPAGWTIKWRRFVSIGGSTPQFSRKLNTKLTRPLQVLPPGLGTPRRELAVLNLLRGKARSLPTGQSVARKMAIAPLTAAQLGLNAFVPNILTSAQAAALTDDTPLWYYLLKEAEIAPQGGARLGPVGGRIVAEVLIGLLDGDPTSYLRMEPTWKPPGKVGEAPIGRSGDITLADLLDFATR